ncbi:MAG: archease [Anaerolineae bacterium]|nr:archease [Anaerolineae bacterium]
MANYEIVDHTADWALRVWGRDLADLLLQAAFGMNSLMVGEGTPLELVEPSPELVEPSPELVEPSPELVETFPELVEGYGSSRSLTLDADDQETLLVDWLSELAYFAEMEQLIFPLITLTNVTPTHLDAQIRGGIVPELAKHIKAVTYHNLEIIKTADGLEATIVFDV